MKVNVQGKGSVVLNQQDFLAKGGEGSVYIKGGTAFKVYDDPSRMIPMAKIQELSVLTHPDIIRPQDILVEDSGKPVGYTMRYVQKSFPLCRMFPKAFRTREGMSPEISARLVQLLRDGVRHAHEHDILVVDVNELNFLIDNGFANVYFIDTDSYQTPHFKATAIMDCIRDRNCADGEFSNETDWFSFAIISFMMFVGIHPYKGKHPKLVDLDSRMKYNVSVLNRQVSVPPACLPLDVIPPAYRSWYELVLENGERSEPPAKIEGGVIVVVPNISSAVSGSAVSVSEFMTVSGDVLHYTDGVVVTDTQITNGRTSVDKQASDVCIAKLPVSGRHAVVWLENRSVKVKGFESEKVFILSDIAGDALVSVDNRVYVKQATHLYEMRFTEISERVVVSLHRIGNVTEHASSIYDGVVISNLLGSYYAVITPGSGQCYDVKLNELSGYKLIDAKYSNRVLAVVGHIDGRYDRLIFRFDSKFSNYDVRTISSINYTGLNFTVLDSGVCVLINESDALEIFSNKLGTGEVKILQDPDLDTGFRLFKNGVQLLGAKDNKLYRLTMVR